VTLSELVPETQICVPLAARTKRDAILELLRKLPVDAEATRVTLRDAVFERESQLTTGIGRGVAIPHGYTAAIEGHLCAVGLAEQPLDFSAIDGQPVRIVILFVCNPRDTQGHVTLLTQIARLLNQPASREAIENASSAAELRQVFLADEAARPAPTSP
jgi:mannitol/fructose-specific phosphotransferase system IIA component (Ntr-type)